MTFLHFNEIGSDFFSFFDNLSGIRAKNYERALYRCVFVNGVGLKAGID